MLIDPEVIVNIADSVEDISACRYLIQSRFGMSAEIGRIWKLSLVDIAEIPRKDWDDDLMGRCAGNRIRFGRFSAAWTQINIRTAGRLAIYRTNFKRTIRIEVRRLG